MPIHDSLCECMMVNQQDNEPLMRALSNLINVNRPNLVLFVGEALVGNDAVDQLTKFNQRLADLATSPTPHTIDGIVLTKFDTIDDKVGCGCDASDNVVTAVPRYDITHSCRLVQRCRWCTRAARPSCLWAVGRRMWICASST